MAKSKAVKPAAQPAAQPASFDAELDALFSAAARPTPGPSHVSVKRDNGSKRNALELLESEGESEDGGDAAEASTSSASTSSASSDEGDDEDDEDEEAVEEELADKLSEIGEEASVEGSDDEDEEESVMITADEDEDENDSNSAPLVHETMMSAKSGKAARKSSSKADEEPREVRDRRSIFVGNLPVSMVKDRTAQKALRRHLVKQSPYPSATKVQSIRFRSIPFSKPTDDYEARNPDEANNKMRKRQRSQAHKDALNGYVPGEGESAAKRYLTGSQKRKVAFITQQINDKAESINAYVTLEPIEEKLASRLKETEDAVKVDRLTAPVLAALLARGAHGTVFEGRHLRVDLVASLEPTEIVQSGLDTIITADGSILGAKAGGAGVDREGRKRTIFVGNMDFEVRDEEVRDFFNLLMTGERGEAPLAPKLDFRHCKLLPTPETQEDAVQDGADGPERSWVQDVRVIRDAATQMGKGFGYVRFYDAACVDELLALHESEEAFLAAAKSGKAGAPTTGAFRRKLKLKGRPLRVSRCKVPKGNVTPASRDGTDGRPKVQQTPNGKGSMRSRSSGAPTPGGTSPYAEKRQRLGMDGGALRRIAESPLSASKKRSEHSNGKPTATVIANPAPRSSDPLKAAQVAQKKADPDRQARRMAKKDAKRTALKMQSVAADLGTTGKVSLKPKSSSVGGAGKKGGKPSGAGSKPSHRAARPVKRGLGRGLAALAMMTLTMLFLVAVPASANNEIVNFGPVMCPADEVGHLQDRAARQVSRGWPVIRSLTGPQLFSLMPHSQPDVWLTLAIAEEDGSAAIDLLDDTLTPAQLATASFPLLSRGHDDAVSPRDRWIARLPLVASWYAWSYRRTFRLDWPANFGLGVRATVHTPQSMLAAGRARWRANGHEHDEHRRTRDDDADAPQWPCARVYVHVHVEDEAVAIPPRRRERKLQDDVGGRVYETLVRMAEWYVGPLATDDGETPLLVPVHLLLEPLYLGFLPHTALGLLTILIPLLVLAYHFIVPLVQRIVSDVMEDEDSRRKSQ